MKGWHAVWWDSGIVSIAELTGRKAPLARDGAVALDNSGDLLAVETRNGQILIAYGNSAAPGLFDVGVWPLAALALSGCAARWAAATLDGHIALHDIYSGELSTELTMETQSLTALAFSADGRLLAAGDGDGHVVVYRIDSGQVVRKFETGKGIRALALHDEGFPLLISDADGRVVLYRRALPPKELEGDEWDLSSLTCLSLTSGGALAGSARGTISEVDFGYRGISPSLNGVGPVRALGAGSSGRLQAVVSGPELGLRSWHNENSLTQVIRSLPGVLGDLGEMVTGWVRELLPLVTGFDEVREQMRDDIAAGRTEMLDRLALDQATRDRIRPVVVASAISIFDSYSFDMAARKIFDLNPLPRWLLGIALTLLTWLVVFGPLADGLGHLRDPGAWVTVGAVVTGAAWITRRLGRLGAAGRAARNIIFLAAIVVTLGGTQVGFTEPGTMQRLVARWLPAAGHLTFEAVIPYPVWLAAAYVTLFVVARTLAMWVLGNLRAPGALALRRRVLGASLLHALLDVAYQAQVMADNSELAESSAMRTVLHEHVRLAARIASREWVAALRTEPSRADRIIRDQGHAIAAAINRWERPAVLAGAQLPVLSQAFAVAVVNAADSDWEELAGNHATPLPRHPKLRMLARQGLTLLIPLGAAVGIVLGVRPLPTAVIPLLTFLVGLAVARVLRWLDFSADIDPALTVSSLLRKPH
jgi:hypothetical protein